MGDQERRKALRADYEQIRPEAAVYCIRNTQNNRLLLGSTTNLASLRNRLAFARSSNTAGVLNQRLNEDVRRFGHDAFALEVLEVLEVTPEMTRAAIAADLATLEGLWREKLDPALLY